MRPLPTLALLAGPAFAVTFAERLRAPAPVRVARVVDDVADLLACAHAGLAPLVLLGADLPGLDRSCVLELTELGITVIGVASAGPEEEADRAALATFGVRDVIASTSGAVQLVALLNRNAPDDQRATNALAASKSVDPTAIPVPWPPVETEDVGSWREIPIEAVDREMGSSRAGRIVAIWGPTGAPGRSTIAAALAALVSRSRSCLLVDLDVYGGAQSMLFGLPDEGSGLAAAVHAAGHDRLDRARLADLATPIRPGLAVLTGLPHARGWPRIRPVGLRRVLERAKLDFDLVVLDCGFCLEEDEELSYDTRAPRRNAASVTALETCDEVVVVAGADRIGLTRLADALPMLQHVLDPRVRRRVVLNRVRPVCFPAADEGLHTELVSIAEPADVHLVPDDPVAFDAALAAGRPVPQVMPDAEATAALARLARDLTGARRRV